MRTNLKVVLRRLGLLDKELPIEKLEESASKYWTDSSKEGLRYNLFMGFRYIVFRDYKDLLTPFLKDVNNKKSLVFLMDKVAMDAVTIAYAQQKGGDEEKVYFDVLEKATNSKSPITFTATAAMSNEIAKKYIRAREDEYTKTLGGAMQRLIKKAGAR